MKLTPTMFYDPEPDPENVNAYEAWKRRQIRPKGFFSDSMTEYYNEHRLRFEGFTRAEETVAIEITDGKLTVAFEKGGPGTHIFSDPYASKINLHFADGLSLNLFRQICQENEINLQEI